MRMNRWSVVIVLFALTFVAPFATFAQESFRVTSVTVSSGEDPISSGLTGIVDLTKKGWSLQVAVQQEQAWVLYGPMFKLGPVEGLLAGSIAHFQGAPSVGLLLSLSVPVSKHVAFSTFHWPGAFPWEPRDWKTENDGVENSESLFAGYAGSARLDIGPVGLVYSWLNFLDEPWNTLPGVVYTAKVREDFSISGSATWNSNAEEWMFYVGATWQPKKN